MSPTNRLKSNKIDNKKNNKEKLIFGIVLAVVVVLYNLIWVDKTFTLSEGWSFFYSGLLSQGKVPYRDFYYYLPPLNLLIDYIIWKLSFGYYIIYRVIRLVERVLIVELIYTLISKKVNPFISFIGSFLGAIMASANVYDLGGDYNQTVQTLTVFLCIFVLKYTENFDNVKKRCFWMFLIGICGGCMFLSKQTIVVACAIIFVGLIFLFLITKTEKNIFKMIFSVAFGLAIPMGICGIYLVLTHSLTEFVTQVFMDTSSKGSLVDIVIGTQAKILNDRYITFILIIAAFVFMNLINKKFGNKLDETAKKYLDIIYCIFGVAVFSCAWTGTIMSAFDTARITYMLFLFIAMFVAILFINLDKTYGKVATIIFGFATVAIMFWNFKSYTESLYSSGIFNMVVTVATYIHFALALWVAQHIVKHYVYKKPLAYDSLVLACSALASGWATAMTNGEHNVLSSTAFISVPVFVYILFKNKKTTTQVYTKFLVIGTLVILSICAAQKIQCPYSWWGDTEASYFEKTETSNIKALKGFKFSKDEKKRFDKINEVIEANTDENSTIFGFPYIKVYNTFQNNYNMSDFVPVLFYDVCSDGYAKKDAKLLAKNEPDIVVWHDIPGCMSTHESIFRDGDALGQRKVQTWFYKVYKTDYELIAQVDDVFVYKLKKDGEKPTKTYIEESSRKNKTLKKDDLRTVENTLKGEGTEENPYLISSLHDFKLFRTLVNQGTDFETEYVKQTADIDLSSIDNWKPIGVYGKEKYFSGTYDGNGYKISNMTITYDEDKDGGYVGMFGLLYGTVVNVTLENCDISGLYIGGIASNAAEYSSIINCTVIGKLNGVKRAGGIVDNSAGNILNCVTECQIESKKPAGIVSYISDATIKNCFSLANSGVSDKDGAKISSSSSSKLNSYAKTIQDKYDYFVLNKWSTDENNKLSISNQKHKKSDKNSKKPRK